MSGAAFVRTPESGVDARPVEEVGGERTALRGGIAPHRLWPDSAFGLDDVVETARPGSVELGRTREQPTNSSKHPVSSGRRWSSAERGHGEHECRAGDGAGEGQAGWVFGVGLGEDIGGGEVEQESGEVAEV